MIVFKLFILTLVVTLLVISAALFFKSEKLQKICRAYSKHLQSSSLKIYNENDEAIFLYRFSFGGILAAAGLLLIFLQL